MQQLEQAKRIVITTHKSPDGDAIGSSLALYHLLKKMGKEVAIIVPDAFPHFLGWMPGSDSILQYDIQQNQAHEWLQKSEVIFCLDYNALSRIGDLSKPVEEASAYKIVIDHHQDPKDFANHYRVDSDCSSTCQLIYEFMDDLNKLDELDANIASCIYCGIMTDTGSFRFPSTTAKTHRIIAHLMEAGANGSKIHEHIYDTRSNDQLRLLGFALTEKMKVNTKKKTAYISLSQEELQQFNFRKGDTEGLVNYPLSIAGIKFSVLLMEKEGQVRLSFRSKDDVYVNEFANKHFEGGGHIYAAGGISYLSLDETVEKLEQLMAQLP